MPNIIKCQNNHFYDRSIFSICPHCESGIVEDENSAEYKKKVSQLALEYLEEKAHKINCSTDMPPVFPKNSALPVFANSDDEPSLNKQRKSQQTIDSKTIGLFSNGRKEYFVTGWLVCVDGPDTGHSFNLHHGYNTLGYNKDNQVCLSKDLTVSQKVHCSVVYDDRKNRFFLVSEKNNDTYLNGKHLENVSIIQTGDIIQLGKTQLEFIAFCRESRKWDKKDMDKPENYGD